MQKSPTILTSEETERLLNAIRYPQGPRSQSTTSFRNFLCCLFMLDAGLRVSEAIQLKRFMIYSNGVIVSALTVPAEIAKLHRSRVIPLTQRLKEELLFCQEYLWVNCEQFQLGFIFHTGDPRRHITDRRIRQIVQTAGLATLGRKVWPHVLRHTFATNLMRVTSTRVVQELLGHKNLTSTQIYTHPNSQDLLNAITAVEKT